MTVATGAGWITTGERHEHDSGVARLGHGSPTSARTAACHGAACAPHL